MNEELMRPTFEDWNNRERINLRPTIVIDGVEWDMGDALLFGIKGATGELVKKLRALDKSAND